MAGFTDLASSTFSAEIFDNNFAAIELQNTYQHGRGIVNGLAISAGAAYTVNVAEGRLIGLISKYLAAFTITMTVSTVRYLWVNEAGASTLTITDADPGGTYVCLGKGTCDGAGAITVTNEGRMDLLRWSDLRTAKIGDNLVVFSLASGANRVGIGKVPTQGAIDLLGELYGSSNFDFGSGQLKFDATNKRLGIRTSSPSDALHVNAGHIRFAHVTAPTAATLALNGTSGLVDNGNHYVKYTYVSPDGETEAGTASAVINVTSNKKIDVSAIPVSSDSAVTQKKEYMTKAGATSAGPYYYTGNTIANGTTTSQINVADASLVVVAPKVGTTAGDIKVGSTVVARIDQIGRLSHNTNQRESVNVETLAGTKNLTLSDANYQVLNPGGANRDVNLPSLEDDPNNFGMQFTVIHGGSANSLVLKEPGGATVATIGVGEMYIPRPRNSTGVPIWPTGGPYATTTMAA